MGLSELEMKKSDDSESTDGVMGMADDTPFCLIMNFCVILVIIFERCIATLLFY